MTQFKMIQSGYEALNYNKELDTQKISLTIQNRMTETQIERKLVFSKEIVNIGSLLLRVGDVILFKFSQKGEGDK